MLIPAEYSTENTTQRNEATNQIAQTFCFRSDLGKRLTHIYRRICRSPSSFCPLRSCLGSLCCDTCFSANLPSFA